MSLREINNHPAPWSRIAPCRRRAAALHSRLGPPLKVWCLGPRSAGTASCRDTLVPQQHHPGNCRSRRRLTSDAYSPLIMKDDVTNSSGSDHGSTPDLGGRVSRVVTCNPQERDKHAEFTHHASELYSFKRLRQAVRRTFLFQQGRAEVSGPLSAQNWVSPP